MLLGRLPPCARLAYQSCWSQLSALLPRAILAMEPLNQSHVPRTASSYSVHPFGKFVFDGPGHVNVTPVSPQVSPNMDQCTISCDGDDTRWSVTAKEDICSITSDSKEETSDTWTIHLPIKYGM